jgi:hypothetical protein
VTRRRAGNLQKRGCTTRFCPCLAREPELGRLRVNSRTRPLASPSACREGARSTELRRPERLPPVEDREAVLGLAAHHIGLGRDELVALVAHVLGFRSTGVMLKEVIDGVVQHLITASAIKLHDGRIYLP